MSNSTIYSALDLRDGFYQILMRESDIPLTAVSTPSGMLWEWLVMPQGLKNAPATFNRCVTHLLRSVREFAPSYFDDVYVHSRAVNEKTAIEMHKEHILELLRLMWKHKLDANLKKCIFSASEVPVLGYLVGKNDGENESSTKPAERNYPVHDKEFLAMKYALEKFRVYLLGNTPFVVYTDHASLRTAVKSPHISQRMARWLSFFAEYNFQVKYKPGRLNVVADVLSRWPDYSVETVYVNRIDVADDIWKDQLVD
ncbi:hypothetical protein PHMEG_00033544 [Phytophthora megakarya]|uniref:Reverse transcriptase domain-containing protein n=1 Tax=Phytophthora megakarya TaxID=4795 RepID=A0A225UVK7_9STRA|nr:hypothetical protein PHMEG_00033544 [Phytophthora megakarya]